MFNKPSVFGRNEPVTRRDAVPVLASGAPAQERNAIVAKAASVSPPTPLTPPLVVEGRVEATMDSRRSP